MADLAIRVEGLGKRYRIGSNQPYKALRDTLTAAGAAPFRALANTIRGGRSKDGHSDPASSIWALKEVSLEIKQGEVLGIIGSNGAGKTTLLKILSRITDPTEGFAEIRGRVGSLLEVGTGFHPELTGRENIYLNGAIIGMKKAQIKQKFDEIVAFAEVERFIETPLKHYSSGMYVRLAFAVSAHLEPDVLLVDEVLAVGDAAFQKKCMGKMQEVGQEGRTVVLVSHNMAAISSLATRCIWIKEGRVARDGATSTVISSYLEESAAADQSGVVNLRERIGQVPSPGHVQLKRLEMTDAEGVPRGQFYEGEPIHMAITFDVNRQIQQLELNVTVSTMGVRLFSVNSGVLEWKDPPDAYTMHTTFQPNPLRPGIYTLSMGLLSSVWQDGAYDVATFEIVDNPSGHESSYPSDGNFGVLDLMYRWGEPVGGKDSVS